MRSLTCRIASAASAQIVALAILSLAPVSGLAQTAGPVDGPPGQLTDAQARLVEAIHRNGLNTSETPAWHLKFSYQTFDANGTATEMGTFEEFWAGAKKYKRIYTVGGVSQTEFQTETGLMIAGDGAPSHGVLSFRSDLIRPLPEDKRVSHLWVEVEQRQTDGMSLQCFRISPTTSPQFSAGIVSPEEDCIDMQTSALRAKILTPGVNEDRFDHPQTFLGRFVPGDIHVIRMGKLRNTIHLEAIQAIGEVRDADFAPPPGAHAVTRQVKILKTHADGILPAPSNRAISAGVAQRQLRKSVAPEYPLVAKAARVSGTVVLQAIIGKDGQIHDLKAVSGPPMLLQSALDAVQQWEYEPYRLNGEPVEVLTTINVVFQLGEPKAKPSANSPE
jgi:TonB family protein